MQSPTIQQGSLVTSSSCNQLSTDCWYLSILVSHLKTLTCSSLIHCMKDVSSSPICTSNQTKTNVSALFIVNSGLLYTFFLHRLLSHLFLSVQDVWRFQQPFCFQNPLTLRRMTRSYIVLIRQTIFRFILTTFCDRTSVFSVSVRNVHGLLLHTCQPHTSGGISCLCGKLCKTDDADEKGGIPTIGLFGALDMYWSSG